jgi:hypothetical protein
MTMLTNLPVQYIADLSNAKAIFTPGTQIRQDLDWTKMETEIPMVRQKNLMEIP